jgi:hypothetical protein
VIAEDLRETGGMSDATGVRLGARLIDATRTGNGVVLTFDDGETAFYPAALLYAALPSAQKIAPSPEDEEE